MRDQKKITLVMTVGLLSGLLFAPTQAQAENDIYGYFSLNYENVGELPDGGNDPGEFSYPHLNIMLQNRLSDQFRVHVNLAGDGAEELVVRNYWGEYQVSDHLKFRVGKIYRPFGLFNEKLDAVPTYLGIEPPELFDKDHLMLPRTSEVMVHGNIPLQENTLNYALMTGNKEVIADGKPISWDLNLNIGNRYTLGTSGYRVSEEGSPIGIGEGSPPGGILPWMVEDQYTVLGGYAKGKWNNFTVKATFWTASHDAVRDPQAILQLDQSIYLNRSQRQRFGLDRFGDSGNIADIDTDGDYTVTTYYLRLGYTIPKVTVKDFDLELTPYAFWDVYENKETIAEKTYGGDNEAGLADDGKFAKPTLGIAIKPRHDVALKIDASSHMYKWTDPADPSATSEDVHYEEIRFEASFFFE